MPNNPTPLKDGLWQYFLLTFAFSWTVWGIAIASGMSAAAFPGNLLFLLGACGPTIVGTILYYRRTPKGGRDLWRRLLNFRQVSPAWWALILLGIPFILLLAINVNKNQGFAAPGYIQLLQIGASPLLLFPLLLQYLVAGPLAEELGWRGFALDRMTRRWGLNQANLWLAPIWWAWHLPLFSFSGTTQAGWGWFSAYFWLFFLLVFCLTVFTGYAYITNRRSLLAAVGVHFVYNLSLNLISPVGLYIRIWFVILFYVLVFGILYFCRGWVLERDT